jgi:hypothetical protein
MVAKTMKKKAKETNANSTVATPDRRRRGPGRGAGVGGRPSGKLGWVGIAAAGESVDARSGNHDLTRDLLSRRGLVVLLSSIPMPGTSIPTASRRS